MMVKTCMRVIITTLFTMACFHGLAQDSWLYPNKFIYPIGEKAEFILFAGENFMGKPVELSQQKIENFTLYNKAGKQDLTAVANRADKNIITYLLNQIGTQIIILQHNSAIAELNAEDLNKLITESL